MKLLYTAIIIIPGWTGLLITILIPPTVVAATRNMYCRLLESRIGMFENVTEPDEPVSEYLQPIISV